MTRQAFFRSFCERAALAGDVDGRTKYEHGIGVVFAIYFSKHFPAVLPLRKIALIFDADKSLFMSFGLTFFMELSELALTSQEAMTSQRAILFSKRSERFSSGEVGMGRVRREEIVYQKRFLLLA